MRRIFLFLILFAAQTAFSQDMKKFNLYKPEENAETEIDKMVSEAKKTGKHVLIQIGGNWCIWCARFHEYVKKDISLDSFMNASYMVYHLNYSKENYNAKLLTRYNFPQRFGFPVFLILDGNGNLIHTQNSWYLEENQSYNKEKIMAFFNEWSAKSLDPKQYKEE